MRINPGDTVKCYDGKVFSLSHKTPDNYIVGAASLTGSASQRLFKPNGQYAGADRSKNVCEVM